MRRGDQRGKENLREEKRVGKKGGEGRRGEEMRGSENRRQQKRSFKRRGSQRLREVERDIYALRLIDRQVKTKRDGEGGRGEEKSWSRFR